MAIFTEHPVLKNKGFTLIEIILGISMLTASLISITTYYKKVLDVSQDTTRHIQSGFLLEEGIESTKLFRDKSWATNIAALSTTTTYYFYWNGTLWTPTTTKQVVESVFTRSFVISDVTRDVSDNIASSGTYDAGTKKVTVSVAWQTKGGRQTATDTAETYIMDLFSN
jgi:Tfp pilus assembly protein PilV